MANKDVGSAQVNCPDGNIAVFLKCLDGWSFIEPVHVRLSGDKTGTEETKNSVRFPRLLKGSYKIELTLKGEDAFCKDKDAFLTSSSESDSLKKLTLERKDGEEEATLKADVPIKNDPDQMSVLIHFQPPCHAASSTAFVDPDAPDSKTPSYDELKKLQEADAEEKRVFKSKAEDLKIAWEMQKDDDQLKAEFVKKAQVTIHDNNMMPIWFEYVNEEDTKKAEKGEFEWKGDVNVSEQKDKYADDLAPSTLSPFFLSLAVKKGVGVLKHEIVWSYLERACILKLLMYRGSEARNVKFNMSVFDTEDNLKGGAPLCEVKKISSEKILLADVAAKFALKTALVAIKFLDEMNKENGEGLILKIEDPGKISKPSVASQRLQCLGYYKDSNLLTEKSVGDLSEQKYLDFYSTWGDYNRVGEEMISGLEKADWDSLENNYWEYDYEPRELFHLHFLTEQAKCLMEAADNAMPLCEH